MITLDLQEVKGHTAQLQKIGVHINQIAKRVMKRFVKCFFELLTQALIRAVGNGARLSNPVLRFRRRNGSGKNPDGQGFKSGDFFASFVKKYYLSLDRLNSQNGLRAEIAFHN